MKANSLLFGAFLATLGSLTSCATRPSPPSVFARVETTPVNSQGDAADDPAIWYHSLSPEKSLIIGTNKDAGLIVYNLDGEVLSENLDGELNNVDVRQGVMMGGKQLDVVTSENRTSKSLNIYQMDGENGRLIDIREGEIPLPLDPYGSGLYHSPRTGKLYCFVGSKLGKVVQVEIHAAGENKVSGKVVRELSLPSQVEGFVADDAREIIYIGEEAGGIWKFDAEPDGVSEGEKIYSIERGAPIDKADIEGLAIYKEESGEGYLVVSSQGRNEYVLFERNEPYGYIGTFRIDEGDEIDGASNTDGLEVSSNYIDERFPEGILVVQDGLNKGGNQNFKVISWKDISEALKLE